MDKLREQEMAKRGPVVKCKLNEQYDWLVDYVLEPIKSEVGKAF